MELPPVIPTTIHDVFISPRSGGGVAAAVGNSVHTTRYLDEVLKLQAEEEVRMTSVYNHVISMGVI
jgi:hypothetical protein